MAEGREQISEPDVTGLKYFRRLLPLFQCLHEVGCERVKAGNRQLHMDQYCALVLLFMFNPCLLISLATGSQPTLRTCEMNCRYLQCWADEEELLAHLERQNLIPVRPAAILQCRSARRCAETDCSVRKLTRYAKHRHRPPA